MVEDVPIASRGDIAGRLTKAGEKLGLTPSAPTPLDVRFNAWSRETFAVAGGFVLREF